MRSDFSLNNNTTSFIILGNYYKAMIVLKVHRKASTQHTVLMYVYASFRMYV